LDTEARDSKEATLDVFYEQLLGILIAGLQKQPKAHDSEGSLLSLHLVFELLTYCAKAHGYRMRVSVVRDNIFDSVMPLLKHRAKSLRLDALRFFRALLICKDDDMLLPFIVAHDLFSPIFALLKTTPNSNLLFSALLELFDYIVKTKLKVLIMYLGEQHASDLKAATHSDLDPFKTLLTRYEQYLDARETNAKTLDQLSGSVLSLYLL
jgi:hypothetical protein